MAEQTEAKPIDDDSISLTSTVESVYDPDKEFIVTQILAERLRSGKKEFLIEWEGYPLEKANWEPKEQISHEVLDAWAERRKLERKGIHSPFDVAEWQASQLRFEQERQERKKRRRAKRKRLGIFVPSSDPDTNMTEELDQDDSSDDEAMEEDEVEDIPTPKTLKRKAEPPRKPARKLVRIKVQDSSIQKLDSSPPGSATNSPRRKTSPKKSAEANVASSKRDLEKTSSAKRVRAEICSRSSSTSSSDEPLIQRKRKKRPSPEETAPEKTDARRPDLARGNSSRSDNISLPNPSMSPLIQERPVSSSSTASRAEQQSESGVAPEVPNMTGDPSPPASSELSQLFMDEDPPAEPVKGPRGRPPTRGRLATRGRSTTLRTNVFQSMSSTATRGRKPGTNFHKLAMDQSKNPKIVTNMHLRRKLELQGRDIAEAAPDISALGGLFNPADMSLVTPVRPSTLRKSSSMLSTAQKQKDIGEEGDVDYLFEEKDNGKPSSILSTPTVSRQPTGPKTCFYWHKQQQSDKAPRCLNGYMCEYRHEYVAGILVAPAPEGYIDYSEQKKQSVCFFWDRGQRDNKSSGCDKGKDCKYLHEYKPGCDVAKPPEGYVDTSAKLPADPGCQKYVCFVWDKAQRDTRYPDCEKGSNCGYLHEYRNGRSVGPPPEGYIDVFTTRPTDPGYVQYTCFFWDRAQRDHDYTDCEKGEKCSYLHEYRLGSPVAKPPPNYIDHLGKGASSIAHRQTDKIDEQPPTSALLPPWRTNPLPGMPDNLERHMQQQEQRTPSLIERAPESSHSMLPPRKSESTTASVSRPDPSNTGRPQSACENTAQPPEPIRPQWDPHDPYNAVCHFWWTTNQCTRGDNCKNYHSTDIRLPIAPSIPDQNFIRKRTPCKQWNLYGRCDHSSNCMFSHERLPAPEMPSPTPVSLSDDVSDRRITSTSSVPEEPRKKVVKFLLDEKEDIFTEPEAMSPKDGASRLPRGPKPKFRNDKVCWFWRNSKCKYGDSCNNIHGYGGVDERDRLDESGDIEMSNSVVPRRRDGRREIEMLDRPDFWHHDESRDVPPDISEEPSLIAPNRVPISIPTAADAVAKLTSATKLPRKKVMTQAEYKRNMALKKLGPRAKLVFFGSDELQPVNLDFGDVQHAEESPWKAKFASFDKVTFSHMCMAKDFESQQGYLQRRGIFAGSLVAAEPENEEIVQIIKHVGDELVLRSAGLLAYFPRFNIILFPSSKEEWRFLEASRDYPKEGRLKYFVFESDLTLDRPRSTQSSSLNGKSYRRLMVNMIHGLEIKDLLPIAEKNQNPYKFYLLFPSSAKHTSTFLATWIKDCKAQAIVYESQKEGSWDYFRNNAGAGAVLIHESAAPSIHCLPHLFELLMNKAFVFWYVSDNDGVYPMFPSWQYEPNEAPIGRITATRLFPQGGAMLLTPSFLVAEPARAYEFMKSFRAKVEMSVPGTWKLVCAFDICQYTLDLALSKVVEKDAFEIEHRDDPAKDAKLVDLGISYTHCETRTRIYSFFAWLDSEGLLDSPISSEYSDSEHKFHEERESWTVTADRFIDPDDEPALIEWFAGWSMKNLDVYRKFIVIGTGSSSAPRAKRMKEFVISSGVDQGESRLTTEPPYGKVLDDVTIHNELLSGGLLSKSMPFSFSLSKKNSPSQPQGKKLSDAKTAALNIAAKLTAQAPDKASVTLLRTAQGSSAIESSPLNNQNQPRENTRHGIESPLVKAQIEFCTATGGSPQDAAIFLDRAQNVVKSAIDLYQQENEGIMDLGTQISQLIASAGGNQGSLLATAPADDSIRARQLYGPSSTSNLHDSTSPADLARMPQYDGPSDVRSPRFDAVNDRRPSSSGSNSTTRSGIVTSENGRRFVPTSLRADNSVRKEIAIRPNFVPVEDIERYVSPAAAASRGASLTASLRSSPAPVAPSPRALAPAVQAPNLMDLDIHMDSGSVAGTDGDLAMATDKKENKPEVKKEVKQYTFQDTSSWYERYKQTNGGGWEHIFVGAHEDAIKKSGIAK